MIKPLIRPVKIFILTLLCVSVASCAPAPEGTDAPTEQPTPVITAGDERLSPEPPPTQRHGITRNSSGDIVRRAQEILDGMTLEEKICQMLIIRIDDVTGRKSETEYGDAFRRGLETYPVGGLVFFTENIANSGQVIGMIAAAQESVDIPLFISADEEGGRVRRLSRKLDTPLFDAMFEYRAFGEKVAEDNARLIAGYMTAHGFNLDFAPVADIWTNPENTVIGDRAYSDNAEEASRLVSAAVQGFLDGGIIPTLKHFPGHGDTSQDSHNEPAISDASLDTLRSREFLPFVSGLEAGAPIVMLSHVTATKVDPDNPAPFSETLIEGILRGEMEFDGIVITDALDMGALSAFSSEEIVVRAVEAGCDILLGIRKIPAAIAAIRDNIPEDRIDESVMRILTLKLEFGIMK